MHLEYVGKDPNSGQDGCPTLYRTDDGGVVVQGVKLDNATRAQLRQVADNEDAVYVPASMLDLLKGL